MLSHDEARLRIRIERRGAVGRRPTLLADFTRRIRDIEPRRLLHGLIIAGTFAAAAAMLA